MKKLLFSLLLLFLLSPGICAIEYIGFSLPEDESSAILINLEPYNFLIIYTRMFCILWSIGRTGPANKSGDLYEALQ